MDYPGLIAAVGDFLNRADLYSQVPTFIALAEAKISRQLRVRAMMVNATATISAEFQSVPTDFAGPISMKLSTGETLDCIAPDAMSAVKAPGGQDHQSGKPVRYCVVGASFQFSPVPSVSYTVYLVYYGAVPALSSINTTNWLLTQFPDAYLYGALEQAAPYANDRRAGTWAALFESAMAEIVHADFLETFGARLEPRASLVV